MTNEDIKQAVYDKYIKPIKRKHSNLIGIEFEFPIVNKGKQPVDFSVVHDLTAKFMAEFNFSVGAKDDEGNVNLAEDKVTGDTLSYDCSYNTLELSFGAEDGIDVLYDRFKKYYAFIQSILKESNHTLTGMGINPYHEINHKIPVPNGRYRMLFHHLSSYKKYLGRKFFHDCPDFGLFSCASQVQLDVDEENAVQVLNTFSRLEPIKSIIFANSVCTRKDDLLCCRDYLWKNSLHGLNSHNVDMYDTELTSTDEIVEYIMSMSIYCTERDGKYINFEPTELREYFAKDKITGEYFDGEKYQTIEFEPDIKDLGYLRSFKLEDLTFRGTVEFRSVCEQPVREVMSPAAFHVGLINNLDKLMEKLKNDRVIYGHGYSASELRELFNTRYLPAFVKGEDLVQLVKEILDIASEGLIKRGLGEERYLLPLYKRANHLMSPARQIKEALASGADIEFFIDDFAELD